ncbi:hypothetical protein EAF04_010113 [Stromatinia cepivora]|nr:hypothetical protein EAF04_010113 [Stromatinia cepivora]
MKFSATLIFALSVAAASATAIEERATARYTIKNFQAACTSGSSCSYSFDSLIGTGTTGSGTSYSITLPTSDGRLPDVAGSIGTCSGINFWFTRTSAGLEFWNSIRITYSGYVGNYLIPASDLSTSGGVEHYTGPTSFFCPNLNRW